MHAVTDSRKSPIRSKYHIVLSRRPFSTFGFSYLQCRRGKIYIPDFLFKVKLSAGVFGQIDHFPIQRAPGNRIYRLPFPAIGLITHPGFKMNGTSEHGNGNFADRIAHAHAVQSSPAAMGHGQIYGTAGKLNRTYVLASVVNVNRVSGLAQVNGQQRTHESRAHNGNL